MIVFPKELHEDEKLKIVRLLYNKDKEIEQLTMELNRYKEIRKDLLDFIDIYKKDCKVELKYKLLGYDLFDANYPKDFGSGYTLEDFAPGTFQEGHWFINKESLWIKK